MHYKFTLDKGSKKFQCPACRRKTFVRYVDVENGDYLPAEYGRCDREVNCGYHQRPDKDTRGTTPHIRRMRPARRQETASYVPDHVFRQSLRAYEANNFAAWLNSMFDAETVKGIIARYHIGTSKYWPGSTVFWQIDRRGRVRTGKVMLYAPSTGKRVREPFNHVQWAHSALKLSEFNLTQCLFGLHLLADDSRPVAIVESEKTAIIASVYLPGFIWMATGGLGNLRPELFEPLKGRRVVLFPDLGGYERWNEKSEVLRRAGSDVAVSDLLERRAGAKERAAGLDLADFLMPFARKSIETPSLAHYYPTEGEIVDSTSHSKANIERFTEGWMPAGWYYQIREDLDGKDHRILINGPAGCPASWTEPKDAIEGFALMAAKNPALINLKERLGLVPGKLKPLQ